MLRLSIVLVLLGSTLSAQAATIETYTGSSSGKTPDGKPSLGGFAANSHVLIGDDDECVLFDAQFTRADARGLAQFIQDRCATLQAIVITHEHPDHYWGLAEILRVFGEVPVVTSPEVVAAMHVEFGPKYDFWGPIYGEQLVARDQIRFATATAPEQIAALARVRGADIEVLPFGPGESEASIALYIEALSAVITGDLAYNHVHPWLVDNHPIGDWQASLHALLQKQAAFVYTGHSKTGTSPTLDPDTGKDPLDVTADYLTAFAAVLAEKPASSQVVIDRMLRLFPDFALPEILQLGAAARVPAPAPMH
jgi:glyoxylase-like metal-dependent hydrolase (beta-lactamase superfamily II)